MGSQAKRDHDVLYGLTNNICLLSLYNNNPVACAAIVGLQPTVIASRAPHLLLEQSVMIQKIVDVHRPSSAASEGLYCNWFSKISVHRLSEMIVG